MSKVRSVVLTIPSMLSLLFGTAFVLFVEFAISAGVKDNSVVASDVACFGKRIGGERSTELSLQCGSRAATTGQPTIIASYVTAPNQPLVCTVYKSDRANCDVPKKH